MRVSSIIVAIILILSLFTPAVQANFLYQFKCASSIDCGGFGFIEVKGSAIEKGEINGVELLGSIIRLNFTFTNIDDRDLIWSFDESYLDYQFISLGRMIFTEQGDIDLINIYLGDTVTPLTSFGAYIQDTSVRFDAGRETGRTVVGGIGWVRYVSAPFTTPFIALCLIFIVFKQIRKKSY